MAFLSSIFGGDDSSSSNDSNFMTDTVSDISSVLDLNFDSSQSNYNESEDGDVSYSTNDNSLDLGFDTDSLLGNMTDLISSSEQTTD